MRCDSLGPKCTLIKKLDLLILLAMFDQLQVSLCTLNRTTRYILGDVGENDAQIVYLPGCLVAAAAPPVGLEHWPAVLGLSAQTQKHEGNIYIDNLNSGVPGRTIHGSPRY